MRKFKKSDICRIEKELPYNYNYMAGGWRLPTIEELKKLKLDRNKFGYLSSELTTDGKYVYYVGFDFTTGKKEVRHTYLNLPLSVIYIKE